MTVRFCILLSLLCLFSCENKELNEGEKFRPRQLHDNFNNSHFTEITIDGVEYLMLERDNNNPHEGFGFMAIRGNNIISKIDTNMAYLKALSEFQIEILKQLNPNSPTNFYENKFKEAVTLHLKESAMELELMQHDSLIGHDIQHSKLPAKP